MEENYKKIRKINEGILNTLKYLREIDLPEDSQQRLILYLTKVSKELQLVMLEQLQLEEELV